MATAEIHDLGYRRYDGPRRPAATRWRVIARHEVAAAWQTWWRYKVAIVFAIMITCGWGGLLWFFSQKQLQWGGGAVLTFRDAALPMSIEWYCRAAFYLSLTIGARSLAGDMQSGAFTFYFARSVRPRDYVLGKLAGYAAVVWTVAAVGPLVMCAIRLGLCDDADPLTNHLDLIPRTVAVGLIVTVTYTVIPLGFSALLPDRRTALALWAAYYLVFGTAMWLIAKLSGGSDLAAADPPTACLGLAFRIFDFAPIVGKRAARELAPEIAGGVLAALAILAIIVLWVRVARAQARGVGGSS